MQNAFNQDGYIILRNAVGEFELSSIEKKIDKLYQCSPDSRKKYFGACDVPFASEVITTVLIACEDVLSEIFDDPIILPDFVLQIANHPANLLVPHMDSQSYLRDNLGEILVNLKYLKIGLYFQDSSFDDPSGGILVVPSSHRVPSLINYLWARHPKFAMRLDKYRRAFYKKSQIPVSLKRGDVLLFDGRLLHSSPPLSNKHHDFLKRVVYFSAVGDVPNARAAMKTEVIKLAHEISQPTANDCQRIDYAWNNPLDFIDRAKFSRLKFINLSSNIKHSIY